MNFNESIISGIPFEDYSLVNSNTKIMETQLTAVDLHQPQVKKVVGDILSQSHYGRTDRHVQLASLAGVADDFNEKWKRGTC